MNAIDRNRGVSIRVHPSGMRVFMYKDTPGVFLDEKGGPLGAEAAKAAGYDVDDLLREKSKNERIAEARRKVEAEFEEQQELINKVADADPEGLHVKSIARGKWAVYSGEQRLTKYDMTKAEAEALLDSMKVDP